MGNSMDKELTPGSLKAAERNLLKYSGLPPEELEVK
jgi:hypothetical protein